MASVLRGCAVPRPVLWALRPGRRSRGEHSRDQQAARGARRYPGRRPPACCWDPVSRSCFLEESSQGSFPPGLPRKDGQTFVAATVVF